MGFGLIAIGIPPTAEEFWRIVFFLITSIFYVAFWLNLAILFSLRFRQAATSALASVAVWLFFSVFYTMIVNLVAKGLSPSQMASPYQIISYQKFILGLMRLAPSELFNEATTTLLMPSVRSIGPLTMEQVQGAIPESVAVGTESACCLATAHGADCSDCYLFCNLIYYVYEKGNPIPIIIYAESKSGIVIRCNLR